MTSATIRAGIDAGGTLIKIAVEQPDHTLQLLKFSTAELSKAVDWISANILDGDICLTGGKAAMLQKQLQKEVVRVVEFEASCNGVRWLMEREDMAMPSFLLTNVGTGTSIHYVDGSRHTRLGGTGVGGGTLIGLSAITTGITDFATIVKLAAKGSRENIDLLVSHIYEGSTPPIPGQLTASNFGRWVQSGGSDRPEDILASIVRLVGETVASVSVHAAGQCGASSVLYIGSSFIQNELLRQAVAEYTELRGSRAIFVPQGEYSGAIGALEIMTNR